MDKARKKAATIIDNEDLGNREKVSEIKKLYKKAAAGTTTYAWIVDFVSLQVTYHYYDLRLVHH